MAKIKRITPLSGMASTLVTMKESIIAGGVDNLPHRQDILNDEFDGIIVDTCCAFDTGQWETAVSRAKSNDGNWIIVEQYQDKAEAQKGHKKWVRRMKKNPTMKLKDIDLWNLGLEK